MKTIKIKPSHESQGDYVLINEVDFDESVHELFAEDGQNEMSMDKMLMNVENLNAAQLKKVCEFLEIEYTNKKEAIEYIKAKTESGE